jgi:hypothetical protein
MKRILILLALLVSTSPAAAQTASPQATAEFQSTQGGFRIVMPCQPDPQADSPVAGLVRVACSADNFYVRATSLPVIVLGEADAELVDEVELAVRDLQQGRIESAEAVRQGTYAGRSFRAASANGIVTMHRIFLVPEKNRMYHVMAAANADSVPTDRMTAVLDSFSIIDAPVSAVTANLITARVASKMNRLLPAPIDQDTELLFTVGLEGIVAYNYRLTNLGLASIDAPKFLATMKGVLVKTTCAGALRASVLAHGLIMRHVYADTDLRQIGIVDIAESDCSAAPPAGPPAPPALR